MCQPLGTRVQRGVHDPTKRYDKAVLRLRLVVRCERRKTIQVVAEHIGQTPLHKNI
jgi:hypothetical protein